MPHLDSRFSRLQIVYICVHQKPENLRLQDSGDAGSESRVECTDHPPAWGFKNVFKGGEFFSLPTEALIQRFFSVTFIVVTCPWDKSRQVVKETIELVDVSEPYEFLSLVSRNCYC